MNVRMMALRTVIMETGGFNHPRLTSMTTMDTVLVFVKYMGWWQLDRAAAQRKKRRRVERGILVVTAERLSAGLLLDDTNNNSIPASGCMGVTLIHKAKSI